MLELNGEPAAITLSLQNEKTLLCLLIGYDFARLRNYSLGLLIIDQMVRNAINQGLTYFDLTVGNEQYKGDFGARPRPLYEILVLGTVRGRVAASVRAAYLHARRSAKKYGGGAKATAASRCWRGGC